MKAVLTICYLVFLGVITAAAISSYLEEYPLWITILGVVIPAVGAISMLLYAFSYKPQFCAWFWKIVPVMLVAYYAISWYIDLVAYRETNASPQRIGVTTILGSLLLLPLLYSSFRFGYSKDVG